MRILVVDDEPDIRVSMRLLLEFLGHTVQTAEGGAEGVAVAHEWLPQAILMDLQMPGMDGFSAISAIRKDASLQQAQIIVISAYVSDPAWRSRALRTGAHECLSKPIDLNRLTQLLEEAAPH